MTLRIKPVAAMSLTALLLLAGCGGGGGGGSAAATGGTISGVAATGMPMAGASIKVTDSAGVSKTTTADANGAYSVNVAGMKAPLVIVSSAVMGDGGVSLVSVSPTAPADGQTVTANVTPLTHALAAALDSTGDPVHLAGNVIAEAANITASKVATATTNLQTALGPLLAQVGASATTDFIGGSFVANGAGLDRLLDSVQISVAPGGNANGGTTIAVKDGNGTVSASRLNLTTTPTALPAMTTVADYTILQGVKDQITQCLAVLPASSRATATICADLVTKDYLNDGKDAATELAPFTQTAFDNAVGDIPQVIRFIDSTHAVVKITVVATNGKRYAFRTVAENTATGWKLRGNQRNFLVGVFGYVQKRAELNPNASAPAGYTSGVQVIVDGTLGQAPTVFADAGSYVKVTGPGIPTAGLILKKSLGTCGYLTVVSASGDTTASRNSCNAAFAFTGAAVDPAKDTAFTSQFIGPVTGGGTPSSTYYPNFRDGKLDDATIKSILPFTPYTVTIHNGLTNTDTVIVEAMRSRPLTMAELPMVRWNVLSQANADSLVPTNASVFPGGSSMTVNWVPQEMTPPVMAVNVQTRVNNVLVGGNLVVPAGSSSATVVPAAAGTAFGNVAQLGTGSVDLAAIGLTSRDLHDLVIMSSTLYTAF